MEYLLRSALLDWLRSGPSPLDHINTYEEETSLRTTPPWLGISASASQDWSTKDRRGRVIRVAIEIVARGDNSQFHAELLRAAAARIEDMPRLQDSYHIVNITFLRGRNELRAKNLRAGLLEYQFHCLETVSENLP